MAADVKVPVKEKPVERPVPVAPEIEVAVRSMCVCGQRLARFRSADPDAPAVCLRVLTHNAPTDSCQRNVSGKLIKWA